MAKKMNREKRLKTFMSRNKHGKFTVNELALLLNADRSTVYRYIKKLLAREEIQYEQLEVEMVASS